jgi:translation initiation factor IF-3
MPNRKDEPRVNHRIRVPRVLVIDEAGNKLGEFLTPDAFNLARERGLDLVEVAPDARPPVCRIIDYGRMKYEKKKKDASAKRNQSQVQLKEIKIRPKTDGHDFNVKLNHARRFLEDGNKVKVVVRFRGREHAHKNIGVKRCRELHQALGELAVIELQPRMDGAMMVMIMAPNKRFLDAKAKAEAEAEKRTIAEAEAAEAAKVAEAAKAKTKAEGRAKAKAVAMARAEAAAAAEKADPTDSDSAASEPQPATSELA